MRIVLFLYLFKNILCKISFFLNTLKYLYHNNVKYTFLYMKNQIFIFYIRILHSGIIAYVEILLQPLTPNTVRAMLFHSINIMKLMDSIILQM